MKRFAINRFLKHKEQFIYMRRWKPELKKVGLWFDDIRLEFPDVKFQVKGREFYINGELAGWAVPLATWQNEKSTSYPRVHWLLFDEFIRENDKSGYVPNEVNAMLNFMHTVERKRGETRLIGASNSVTINNPQFLYFKLSPDINKQFNPYQSHLVEIPPAEPFLSKEEDMTPFEKAIQETEYAEMAMGNVFVNDSYVNVKKRSKDSKFVFGVAYEGITFGFWVDNREGLLYISNAYDPSSKKIYALTVSDTDKGYSMVMSWKNNYYLRKFVSAFQNGFLRYETSLIKQISYDMLRKMRIY